jgi:hypothetical protein
MLVVFLEWSTRRPLDIVINSLIVILVGGIWVGLDVLHSNGFEWNCHSGIGHDLL